MGVEGSTTFHRHILAYIGNSRHDGSTRRIKIGGLAARGSRLFGSSTDDEEVKKLRLLFVTRSMMPIQAPDIGDLEDKLAKGSDSGALLRALSN